MHLEHRSARILGYFFFALLIFRWSNQRSHLNTVRRLFCAMYSAGMNEEQSDTLPWKATLRYKSDGLKRRYHLEVLRYLLLQRPTVASSKAALIALGALLCFDIDGNVSYAYRFWG